MKETIENRITGFRAPSTFHEKVQAFCKANDLTPSQLYRRATMAFIRGCDETLELVKPSKNLVVK